MKYLFSFLMAVLVSLPSYSAEYRLPFVELQNGAVKIPFVEKEWILGSDRDNWSLYVDVHNKIIMRQYHEFGSYVSNMNNPNTIRYNVYNLLCKESV